MGILKVITDIWTALDGKKRQIGGSLLIVAVALTKAEEVFAFHQPLVDWVIAQCTNIGASFGVGGIVHAGIKSDIAQSILKPKSTP